MFVKICGLTNLEDSLAAIDAGAQALGFNFVASSPRYIAEAELSEWIDRIPANIWKVGIFANESARHVQTVCRRLGLQVAQLHGAESPADIPRSLRVWKAFRLLPGFDQAILSQFETEAMLLDGPASGITFDWSAGRAQSKQVVLAGGLNAGNVCEAIAALQPWGVDVCSGVEISHRKKGHHLMTQFVKTALSC